VEAAPDDSEDDFALRVKPAVAINAPMERMNDLGRTILSVDSGKYEATDVIVRPRRGRGKGKILRLKNLENLRRMRID
jgi:hypothetical protein